MKWVKNLAVILSAVIAVFCASAVAVSAVPLGASTEDMPFTVTAGTPVELTKAINENLTAILSMEADALPAGNYYFRARILADAALEQLFLDAAAQRSDIGYREEDSDGNLVSEWHYYVNDMDIEEVNRYELVEVGIFDEDGNAVYPPDGKGAYVQIADTDGNIFYTNIYFEKDGKLEAGDLIISDYYNQTRFVIADVRHQEPSEPIAPPPVDSEPDTTNVVDEDSSKGSSVTSTESTNTTPSNTTSNNYTPSNNTTPTGDQSAASAVTMAVILLSSLAVSLALTTRRKHSR